MTETFIIAVSSPRLILHRGKQNCFVALAGLEVLYPVHMTFPFFFLPIFPFDFTRKLKWTLSRQLFPVIVSLDE